MKGLVQHLLLQATESVVRKANDGTDPAADGSKGNGYDSE